jgi:VIT1/CCC1 family predicted Fe2+/Mn2+ transporter
MTSRDEERTERLGPGERAERARARQLAVVIGSLMLLGAGIGVVVSWLQHSEGRSLPSSVAITVALLYFLGITVGSWYFFRRTDEVELRDHMLAGTVALYFYALVYPIWFFLWKGGLVRMPDHEILFIGTMGVLTVIYYWKKLRP